MNIISYRFRTGCPQLFTHFSGWQGSAFPFAYPTTVANALGSTVVQPEGNTFVNVRSAITGAYPVGDPLKDSVIAIGRGWQRWVVPRTGYYNVTVRGAAGGSAASSATSIGHQQMGTTNAYITMSPRGRPGGRGAKLKGKRKFFQGDVLLIAVAIRGWSQDLTDYGAGGGGASCVLLVDPNGSHTFAPTGQKVTPIFVAGGGGGAEDADRYTDGKPGSAADYHCGRDASYTQSTSETPSPYGNYTTSGPQTSGATLINPGHATGSGSLQSVACPSIMSGLVRADGKSSATNNKESNVGGWPGGGGSWNGGGGGAGYGTENYGGNTTTIASDTTGGGAGKSYVHSSVTDVERGHEWNLTSVYTTGSNPAYVNVSPWALPGEVLFEMIGVDKFIVAEDSEGYKHFDDVQERWVLNSNQNPPDITLIRQLGDVAINSFDGLVGDDVKFTMASTNPSETLFIDGFVSKTVIKPTFEIDVTAIAKINSANITGVGVGVVLKLAVSKDHGESWLTLVNNVWTPIDIADRDAFFTNGIPSTSISTIIPDKWKELSAKSLRFALCVSQNAKGILPVIGTLSLNCDMVGSWDKAVHPTDYIYKYTTPTTVNVVIKTTGDYKINYVDR